MCENSSWTPPVGSVVDYADSVLREDVLGYGHRVWWFLDDSVVGEAWTGLLMWMWRKGVAWSWFNDLQHVRCFVFSGFRRSVQWVRGNRRRLRRSRKVLRSVNYSDLACPEDLSPDEYVSGRCVRGEVEDVEPGVRGLSEGLRLAFDELSGLHQKSIELLVLQGMTLRDAAVVMGVSHERVRQLREEAIPALRGILLRQGSLVGSALAAQRLRCVAVAKKPRRVVRRKHRRVVGRGDYVLAFRDGVCEWGPVASGVTVHG
ncbi:MAG: sigma factor-like helix-turn-helix DNA-binding protein [Phycisphaeraceae bacterium]